MEEIEEEKKENIIDDTIEDGSQSKIVVEEKIEVENDSSDEK